MHRARALTAIVLVLIAPSSCRPRWKKSPPRRATYPVHAPVTRPPHVAPLYSAPTSTATAMPTATTAPSSVTPIGPPPPPAPCTDRFGHALTTSFGRLDGTLVALVPPRTPRCKSDEHHLHLQLQLEADGDAYDVAVPLGDPAAQDIYFLETTAPVPGGRWRAGWSPGASLDYVAAFKVHATDFRVLTRDELLLKLQTELTAKRRVSVWATGYGPGGAHMVHRDHGQHDGTIALDPDSTRSRFLLFRFARQRF